MTPRSSAFASAFPHSAREGRRHRDAEIQRLRRRRSSRAPAVRANSSGVLASACPRTGTSVRSRISPAVSVCTSTSTSTSTNARARARPYAGTSHRTDAPQPDRGSTTADRGSATVLSAVVSMALVAILGLAYQLGTVLLTRHRAEGAADLAALAAAAYAPQGTEFACGRADWVARNMRSTVASCRLDGWEARVEVRAVPPGMTPAPLAAELLAVHARARAGPVPDDG